MTLPASSIMFAIEAGVKLAQKGNSILIDKTSEKPLRLPLGDKPPNLDKIKAGEFFDLPENAHLTATDGPYAGYNPDQLAEVYRTIQASRALDGNRKTEKVIAEEVGRIEQINREYGSKPAVRRVLGTMVEIGIDYALANPSILGKNANQRKIVESFVAGLDDTDFSEGASDALVGHLLASALKTLSENTILVDDDPRTQALLGGITVALLQDVDAITDGHRKWTREQLLRRVGSGLLRGGATVLSDRPDLFMPGTGLKKELVKSAVRQMLNGIEGKEDWFTNETLELLFQSSMKAVAENAVEFDGNKMLQSLIRETSNVLAGTQWRNLFTEQAAAEIVRQALVVSSEHFETMLHASESGTRQLAAETLSALAVSLSGTLGGTGRVHSMFSREQLLDLTQIALTAVARNPLRLLGAAEEDPKKTVLAQAIGSVASALGADPLKYTNGEGFIRLARMVLNVAVQNADQLIDLKKTSPTTNVLYEAIHQVVTAIAETGDTKSLVTRDTFIEIVQRVLPVVSANATRVLDEKDRKIVKLAATTALSLATSEDFKGRINGGNMAHLIGELLLRALWNELNLEEQTAVANAARSILRAAPLFANINLYQTA